MKGPLPIKLSPPSAVPASAESFLTIEAPHNAMSLANGAAGPFSVILTVWGSTASMSFMASKVQKTRLSSAAARSTEKTTSSAVTGDPSENLASGRRWKV